MIPIPFLLTKYRRRSSTQGECLLSLTWFSFAHQESSFMNTRSPKIYFFNILDDAGLAEKLFPICLKNEPDEGNKSSSEISQVATAILNRPALEIGP